MGSGTRGQEAASRAVPWPRAFEERRAKWHSAGLCCGFRDAAICRPELKATSAKRCCKRVCSLSPETLQTCPNGSTGAPYLANRLGHTLLNLSAFRLPEYLLVPSEKPRWVQACGRIALQIPLFQMLMFLGR